MQQPKKKILFLVHLPPPIHGASLMNSYALQSKLIQSEFDIHCLPLQFANSIKDVGTFSLKKLWKMLVFCFKLVCTLAKDRPDLVYFTISPVGGAFYRDALFCLFIKLFGVKRLYHLHGKGIRIEAENSTIKKAIYRFTFQKSNIIILAHALEKDIQNVYKGRPFVLPNGLPEIFSYRKAKNVDTKPVFLFLSNMVRSKGIEIFLECIDQLHKKGEKFKACIVGAPFDVSIEDVQRFIKINGLTEITNVAGPLFGEAKKEVLESADILVFPSYYQNEAFPLTILEAMQAGIPVIASNNGAIPEMVADGQTGFITPLKDKAAIVAKMELLLKYSDLRNAMGEKGREKFQQFYTIEKFEHRLFEIFKQVLK